MIKSLQDLSSKQRKGKAGAVTNFPCFFVFQNMVIKWVGKVKKHAIEVDGEVFDASWNQTKFRLTDNPAKTTMKKKNSFSFCLYSYHTTNLGNADKIEHA